jgi:hypothetical protein
MSPSPSENSMSDPVPAITEAAASGEIAAIFADIRHVLGVDVVNLIWRHLATIEGALPWAWSTLRPLYVDGSVTAEATALHSELALPWVPRASAEVFSGLGLRQDDLRAINDVLAAYDRTNAMALVALSALRARLDGPQSYGETGSQAPLAPPPPPRIGLRRLPSLSELPAETVTLVMALNAVGTRRPGAILASMYRHLAHWPPYLALAWLLLAPLDADGRLEAAIAATRRAADRLAGRLLARLGAPPVEPSPSLATAIATAIEPFIGDVIARMMVICALLRDATPGGAREATL